MTSLSASPAGDNHTFAWDANTDLGPAFDDMVQLRFGVKNKDGTGDEVQHTSDWFRLDFAAPSVTISYPNGLTISDTTPILTRNASDNSLPIQTKWEIDDDPAFGNALGHKQTQGYSVSETWTTAALPAMGTWYFRCMCKDGSASANEGSWVSGSFELMTAIKPAILTDGITPLFLRIVDETIMELGNKVVEYESDNEFDEGGADIIEHIKRMVCVARLAIVDGDTYATLLQLKSWAYAQTELDLQDIGGSDISFGGTGISYTPDAWKIVSIRELNRPLKTELLYAEIILEEV